MLKFRSFKLWCFIIFACALITPWSAAIGADSHFPLRVVGPDGNPVEGARIIIWDKNNSWSYAGPQLTDNDGRATLTLANILQTADSTSNPNPNIGFLVMPQWPQTANLAWEISDTLFYNFFGVEATAPEQEIYLMEGSKVTFNLKYDETNIGLRTGAYLDVNVPSVPDHLKQFCRVQPENLTNGSFDVYWPMGRNLNILVTGDGNRDVTSSPNYYQDVNSSYNIQTDSTFDVVQNVQQKGALEIVQASDLTGTLQYAYNYAEVTGPMTVYLPYGTYAINYAVNNIDVDGFKPAVIIEPSVLISETPVTLTVDPASGAGTTINVQAGGDGEIVSTNNALFSDDSYSLNLEKQIGETWYKYLEMGMYADVSNPAYKLPSRLSTGHYRIRTQYNYYHSINQYGWVDTSNPAMYTCYTHADWLEFDIEDSFATFEETLILPQAPGLHVKINDAEGNQFVNPPILGYFGNGIDTWPQLINSSAYINDVNGTFLPFALANRGVAIRADLPPQTTDDLERVKLFPPILLDTPGTKVLAQPLVFDPADFVKVTGDVQLNSQSFAGSGLLSVNPLFPGNEVPWDILSGGQNAINKEFLSDPGFEFYAPKNSKVALRVAQSEMPGGGYAMDGFLPYDQVLQIGEADIPALSIELNKGGSFTGIVKSNNEAIAAQVGVTIRAKDDYNFVRKGLSDNTGTFVVSGLTTGNYEVSIDIDGINQVDETARYTAQTMPVINRNLFFDQNSPQAELIFNLDPNAIGLLYGSFDDGFNGIPGINVLIRACTEEYFTNNWTNWGGTPVFYCSTNEYGQIVSAEQDVNAQQYIRLEAGYYGIFISKADNKTDDGRYDIPTYENHVGNIKINPRQDVYYFNKTINRHYKVTGVLQEGGTPLPYAYFQCAGMEAGWTNQHMSYGYTDGSGNFEVYLPTGQTYWSIMTGDDRNRNFYLHEVQVEATVNENVMVDLDPNNLTEIEFQTLAGDTTTNHPLRDVYLNIPVHLPTAGLEESGISLWSNTNEQGVAKIKLSNNFFGTGAYLSTDLYSHWEQVPVIDDSGNPVYDDWGTQMYNYEQYSPPEPQEIYEFPAAPVQLFYRAPGQIVVNVSEIPAQADKTRLVGVLMPYGDVADDDQNDDIAQPMPDEPGQGEGNGELLAPFNQEQNQFVFQNVKADREYIFMVYESLVPMDPQTLMWQTNEAGIQFPAVFRHCSWPFYVWDAITELNETMSPLAPLTVVTEPQDLVNLTNPWSFLMEYSYDQWYTTDQDTWPVLYKPEWMTVNDAPPIAFPILVPSDRAYRIGTNDPPNAQFRGKIDENVYVPADGRVHSVAMVVLSRLFGTVTYNSANLESGKIFVLPRGADANSGLERSFLIRAGQYQGFLPAGQYVGYAIPPMGSGVPKFFEVEIPAGAETQKDIEIPEGLTISGFVTGPDQTMVYGAQVLIYRKATARSDISDGKNPIPCPAFYESPLYYCGPAGDFTFTVEDGVDYYLQTVVPAGFRPSAPLKVSLDGENVTDANLSIGYGVTLRGTVNVKAYLEATPAFTSALQGETAGPGMFYAVTEPNPNTDNKYEFVMYGLDPSVPYNITVYPEDMGLSLKTLQNVLVTEDGEPIDITVSEGYKITGKLVDADGNPLKVEGISINLAMDVAMAPYYPGDIASPTDPMYPMDPLASPTDPMIPMYPPDDPLYPDLPGDPDVPTPSLKVMQSIAASEADEWVSLNSTMYQGMWTTTNADGEYEFKNVPEFMSAFIKSENGFTYNKVTYGRAKTESFGMTDFNAATKTLEKDLPVLLGGKIAGRLVDANGNPIANAWIYCTMDENWLDTQSAADGRFTLDGLQPASDWSIEVWADNLIPVIRSGILVQPQATTDLGVLAMAQAVVIDGEVASLGSVVGLFPYGMPEGTTFAAIELDANQALSDADLLRGKLGEAISGQSDIYFDPFMGATMVDNYSSPFSIWGKSGRNHFGVMLQRKFKNGVRTVITWGWRQNILVPTQEQLGMDIFTLVNPLPTPDKFGVIEGSLMHNSDASATFTLPSEAIIALIPVVASGTEYVARQLPMPTAMTNVSNGKWLITNVPHGIYQVKVITKEYGTHLFARNEELVTIGLTPVRKDLEIGGTMRKVFGKVVSAAGAKPAIEAAKVTLILKEMSVATDKEGNFSFNLPDGELVIPHLEIKKPGLKTRRVSDFAGVATEGVTLTENLDLGTIELSGDVGTFEAKVTGKDDKALLGAEVSLVYQESAENPVWTVGEVQETDENGNVRFISVPTGIDVKFRARAHYYKPTLYLLAAANNTGNASAVINLEEAPPKVFYTGRVEANDDTELLTLKGEFDFNRVVVKNDVALFIDTVDRTTDSALTFPDLIGTRITTMTFNGPIPNKTSVVASVTYTGFGEIGRFDLVGGALFRRQFEVDPLSSRGFTGRQLDENGNETHAGLNVPPGFLDPEIDSFELIVEDPEQTQDPLDRVDVPVGEEPTTPEFAGPAFQFVFGGANFGAGSKHDGLFEITLKHDGSANFEPRWYDEDNHRWSKVGIVEGSVKPDYPTAGYVTFKVSHLTKFAVLKNIAGSAIGLRCDFTGDGLINDADLMFLLAARQVKGLSLVLDTVQYDLATVKSTAGTLYTADYSKAIMPSESIDDLNGNTQIDDQDLIILLSYLQVKGLADVLPSITLDIATVRDSARTTLSDNTVNVTNFPGDRVNR